MGPFNNFARPQIRHVPVPCRPACHYNINNISTWFMKITRGRKVIVLLAQLKINRILSSKMLRPILFHHWRHSWWGIWRSSIEAVLMLPVGTSWPNKCSDVPLAGVKNEWNLYLHSRTCLHGVVRGNPIFLGIRYYVTFCIFYKRSKSFLENKRYVSIFWNLVKE